jgi:MFS transporter, DHA1 family, multidrug resistance protein
VYSKQEDSGLPETHGRVPPQSSQEASKPGHDDRIWVRPTGDDDELDPHNWPLAARCKNIAILSLLIFAQGWAGAAESMANSAIKTEFGISSTAENLSTSMYLFGIGSGALFAGPLSETVGRNPTYLISTFFYMLFVLGSALTPTFGGQIVCRYLVGLFSSATLSINGSSVGDQFRPVKRAFVFPVVAWANVAGKCLHSSPSTLSHFQR